MDRGGFKAGRQVPQEPGSALPLQSGGHESALAAAFWPGRGLTGLLLTETSLARLSSMLLTQVQTYARKDCSLHGLAFKVSRSGCKFHFLPAARVTDGQKQ